MEEFNLEDFNKLTEEEQNEFIVENPEFAIKLVKQNENLNIALKKEREGKKSKKEESEENNSVKKEGITAEELKEILDKRDTEKLGEESRKKRLEEVIAELKGKNEEVSESLLRSAFTSMSIEELNDKDMLDKKVVEYGLNPLKFDESEEGLPGSTPTKKADELDELVKTRAFWDTLSQEATQEEFETMRKKYFSDFIEVTEIDKEKSLAQIEKENS